MWNSSQIGQGKHRPKEAAKIVEIAKENVVVIGKGGVLDNMLRINPPLYIQKEDVDLIANVFDHAFQQFS